MCIAVVCAVAGQAEQLALECYEVGDHTDGLDRRGVGVSGA